MRRPTAEEKASWPDPNFYNPEKLQAPVIGATVISFTLAVICESQDHCEPYQEIS